MAELTDITLRPATRDEAPTIAAMFRISSEGVADYVWSRLAADYPGLSLPEIGARRYARDDTAFSWQNCTIAEHDCETVGLLHGYVMPASGPADLAVADPVLRPYAELEIPGSFYISALAVTEPWRGLGIGTRLLAAAETKARGAGCPSLSLICFSSNDGARRLYERRGYRIVARRDMVPHPLIHASGDALLMEKRTA